MARSKRSADEMVLQRAAGEDVGAGAIGGRIRGRVWFSVRVRVRVQIRVRVRVRVTRLSSPHQCLSQLPVLVPVPYLHPCP